MDRDVIVAAVQMNSTGGHATNCETAERLVRDAAAQGAELIALPELFAYIATYSEMVSRAEPLDGPVATQFSRLARELGVFLLAGSICESTSPGRAANTSLLFDPDGHRIATYRKIHLFEVDMEGQVVIDESKHFDAGDQVSVVETAVGRIAQSICYDLRFPELFREFASRNADIAVLPSAFTQTTGRDHWQTLIQARAIENQMFLIAPNQVGSHNDQFQSYGHSLIVDPWGDILAEATQGHAQAIVAKLDFDRLNSVRTRLPVLKNRKHFY